MKQEEMHSQEESLEQKHAHAGDQPWVLKQINQQMRDQ